MPLSLTARFERAFGALLAGARPEPLGVAVSGGGDSTALLYLLYNMTPRMYQSLHAVSVDHRLRPGAGAEIDRVAAQCADLGVRHEVLVWEGWDGRGNLQDAARRARLGLIGDWARGRGIAHLALGHTMDDQAETVLMRLGRGSGVDGLCAMAPARDRDGVRWLRPLLGFRRAELRQYLRDNDIGWSEDPSNQDRGFERVKMRQALEILEPLGITATGLAATAARMGAARRVLERRAREVARQWARAEAGAVTWDIEGLMGAGRETRRRLLAHSLKWVGGDDYPPRHEKLLRLEENLARGSGGTLHGCLIRVLGDRCQISREPESLRHSAVACDQVWDNRWRMHGPCAPGLQIGPLGESGLKSCPDWRASGLGRELLMVSPAVWRGRVLVAAPLAGLSAGWRADFLKAENDFHDTLLSH